MSYERYAILLDGSSANSSAYTSNAQLVADAAQMSVSIVSTQAVASQWTLQGSNDHGLDGAITNWSTLSTIVAPGLFLVNTGMRWIRAQRASLDSRASIVLEWTSR